ncbi:hypothetical protein FQA39_LY15212 [Lamprigera yunnana]|nr:hypothetical protein FQA39_LY15212 [Lamprigera yunnana]
MTGHQKSISTHNRGVNIKSEDFEYSEQNEFEGAVAQGTSKLQTDIENMIGGIEANVPHFMYTPSNLDADNEDSIISTTSVVSSIVKMKQVGINKDLSVATNNTSDLSEFQNENFLPAECSHNKIQPICLPTVLCMNPQCVHAHSVRYMQHIPVDTQSAVQQNHPKIEETDLEKKYKLSTMFEKLIGNKKEKDEQTASKLYKMNMVQQNSNSSAPQRFVFDLIENVCKPDMNTTGTNTKMFAHKNVSNIYNTKHGDKKCDCAEMTRYPQYTGMVITHGVPEENIYVKDVPTCERSDKKIKQAKDASTRVDVYYFDHGNAAYYRTTDSPPIIKTELMAEKSETHTTKFWAEVFGTFYIAFAFITSFILQFFRFICHSILRPLTIGLLQLLSDYFFKPFLAVLFNSIIQPPLIFIFNIATSLRDLCDPIAEGLGLFLREIGILCKSIRFFDIRHKKCNCNTSDMSCTCNANKNCQKS